MTRALPASITALLLAATLAGCGSDDTEPAAAPSSAPPVTSAAPSPTTSPSHTPTLPTEMADEGGYCLSAGRCGHYVAGSSCKGVEWCKPAHLVEPGHWETAGGTQPTDCMWDLSEPPDYGHSAGGYASSTTSVYVPAGAVFSTSDCRPGWRWIRP